MGLGLSTGTVRYLRTPSGEGQVQRIGDTNGRNDIIDAVRTGDHYRLRLATNRQRKIG